ncbi:hypothetical protein KEM56_000214 [Ascosphaera pollenicola]|nr:hypothetical protein KEM56_000214 [Ascosphaera pollenicola]
MPPPPQPLGATSCVAHRPGSPHLPERTWAQVVAQTAQQPMASGPQLDSKCQIRKNNGTVNLVQSGARGDKVTVPRAFIASRKPAPEFTCSPLSTPPGSRQSSVSSTATIVIPLAPAGKKRFTYAQAAASKPQRQVKNEGLKRNRLPCTTKSGVSSVRSPREKQAHARGTESENSFWALRNLASRSNSSYSASSGSSQSPSVTGRHRARSEAGGDGPSRGTGSDDHQKSFAGGDSAESPGKLSSSHEHAGSGNSIGEDKQMVTSKDPEKSQECSRPAVLDNSEEKGLERFEKFSPIPIDVSSQHLGARENSGAWTRCKNIWNEQDPECTSASSEEKNEQRKRQLLQLIKDGQNGTGKDQAKHYRGDSDDAISPVKDDEDIDVAVSVFNSLAAPPQYHCPSEAKSFISSMAEMMSIPNPFQKLVGRSHGGWDTINPLCPQETRTKEDGKVQQTTNLPNSHSKSSHSIVEDRPGVMEQTQTQTKVRTVITSPPRAIAPVMKLQDLFDRYKSRSQTSPTGKDNMPIAPTEKPERVQHESSNPSVPVLSSPFDTPLQSGSPEGKQYQSWISEVKSCKTPDPCASTMPLCWKKPSEASPTARRDLEKMCPSAYGYQDDDTQNCRQELGCTTPCGSALLDPTAPTFTPSDWRIIKKRMKPYYNTCVSNSVQPPPCPPMQQPPSQLVPPRTPQLRPISPADIPQYEVEQLPSPYRPPSSACFSNSKSPSLALSYPSMPASPTEMRHRREWRVPSRMMSDGLEQPQHFAHSQHHGYHQSQQARQYSVSPHRKYAYAHPSVYEVSPVGQSGKHSHSEGVTRMTNGIAGMSLDDQSSIADGVGEGERILSGSMRSSSEGSVMTAGFLEFLDPNMSEGMDGPWSG